MIKTKKGELTTTQIITIIVLVVSFVVILYFVYRLNLGSTNNSEICRNSVVLKATGKGLAGDINCKTDYVCISGGGKCDMSSTVTVKVNPDDKKEIMKAISDQLANCWWEFGEGKFNYGDNKVFGSGGCALCSVVEFDNKILAKNYDLSYNDLYTYMATTKKDDTQTYLSYLYGTKDLSSLLSESDAIKGDLTSRIITDKKYSIITSFGKSWFWGVISSQDKLTPPAYVTTDKVSSQLKCSEFVTKA